MGQNNSRMWLVDLVANSVPDLALSWFISWVSDGKFSTFVYAFLALQVLYFIIWTKNTSWNWLCFGLYRRNHSANNLLQLMASLNFPRTDDFWIDGEDYFIEVAANQSTDIITRLEAAGMVNIFSYLRTAGHVREVMQLGLVCNSAVKRYANVPEPEDKIDSFDTQEYRDLEDSITEQRAAEGSAPHQHLMNWKAEQVGEPIPYPEEKAKEEEYKAKHQK